MDDARQAPTQQAPAADRPQRGWFRRNWLWFVPTLFLGLLLPLLLIGVLGVVIWHRVTISPVKSSEPYQMALELVQKEPKVIEQLGEPIEQVFWPPPSAKGLEGGPGRATLNFDVAGPKGRAAVQAEARMLDDKWGLSFLLVTIAESGERITVDTAETSGLETAPKWNPGG